MTSTISILIGAAELQALMSEPANHVVLLDCRHDLMNHQAGRIAFDQGHLPEAQFWNMESDAVANHTGLNGRHPLATREQTRQCFENFGVSNQSTVVVYDAQGGQYAGRLWWLARWIGHANVKLLDGGLPAWQAAGYSLTTNTSKPKARVQTDSLSLKPSLVSWIDKHQVAKTMASGSSLVIDARVGARFRGETEPLDPVAGHIPGAINRFYQDNLEADGRFKQPTQLRAEFDKLVGQRRAVEIIHQCGSGVTACHNLIAMELAGLLGSSLYPGSWSEWSNDSQLPVAVGAN